MPSNEETVDLLYTIFYIFFSLCFIAPPTEFVSAGLTIQNILSNFLGSEDLNFIYYHIRRTTATVVAHSFFPLGYYVGLALFSPQHGLLSPWNKATLWQVFLGTAIALPLCASLMAFYWSRQNWNKHPIARSLHHLSEQGSWRAVASSINVEFRRIDKFTSGALGRRIIVTDSWVMKTSTYFVYVAHQNDIHLTLSGTEEHSISYESPAAAQILKIDISNINPNIKPFMIRLNSFEYGELREKLQAPVRNARSIVIRQSLSDQFLEAFREQVQQNQTFQLTPNMELESCIGCMQMESNVKLQKLCDAVEQGSCAQCFCRPMWCQECMGKWFASRQDQHQPETWMGGRSPCPTCRATFCLLDVCLIVK